MAICYSPKPFRLEQLGQPAKLDRGLKPLVCTYIRHKTVPRIRRTPFPRQLRCVKHLLEMFRTTFHWWAPNVRRLQESPQALAMFSAQALHSEKFLANNANVDVTALNTPQQVYSYKREFRGVGGCRVWIVPRDKKWRTRRRGHMHMTALTRSDECLMASHFIGLWLNIFQRVSESVNQVCQHTSWIR